MEAFFLEAQIELQADHPIDGGYAHPNSGLLVKLDPAARLRWRQAGAVNQLPQDFQLFSIEFCGRLLRPHLRCEGAPFTLTFEETLDKT